MNTPDYFDKFMLTVDGYNKKYPNSTSPFQIITRLCEEAGELASEVNHFEDSGAKILDTPASFSQGRDTIEIRIW